MFCVENPVEKKVEAMVVPDYRKYTESELERGKAFRIIGGTCERKPEDKRDACCMLVEALPDFRVVCEVVEVDDDVIDGESLEGEGESSSLEGRLTVVEEECIAVLGWGNGAQSTLMSGYSNEDSSYFRVFHNKYHKDSAAFEDKESAAVDNIVGAVFVSHEPEVARGDMVVVKVDNAGIGEQLVEFSKAELIDVYLWRVHCGTLGGHSRRMFRENLRRRELTEYLRRTKDSHNGNLAMEI